MVCSRRPFPVGGLHHSHSQPMMLVLQAWCSRSSESSGLGSLCRSTTSNLRWRAAESSVLILRSRHDARKECALAEVPWPWPYCCQEKCRARRGCSVGNYCQGQEAGKQKLGILLIDSRPITASALACLLSAFVGREMHACFACQTSPMHGMSLCRPRPRPC